MIVVTGATGKLGSHVLDSLLQRVPANRLAVAVRNPEKASSFSARGVRVRHADYAKPETLAAALDGAEKVLLISSSEVGQRAPQHQAVIDAARRAGVGLLVYTSILHGDRSQLALAAEHQQTEAAIRASGIPFSLLRNGWYTENYTENLGSALQHGVIVGSMGTGRIAAATRADYASAAAVVLTSDEQANTVYELAGDEPFTMSELAAEVARQAGKPIVYEDVSTGRYREVLLGAGLPAPYADILVDSAVGISRGELDDDTHQLRQLLGRPTTSLADAVARALQP